MKVDGPFIVDWAPPTADIKAKPNLIVYEREQDAIRARDDKRAKGFLASAWNMSSAAMLKGE